MKRILITGANGFIGSALAEQAVRNEYETYAGIRATSNINFLKNTPVKLFEMDFTSQQAMQNKIRELKKSVGRFDYIIHNAGITKAKKKEDFVTVNSLYTQNFVNALINENYVPDKFIYISSLAAYGPGANKAPIRESDNPQPITFYGKSKLSAEQFMFSLKEFPFLIIRPAAVYGPRDKEFLTLFRVLNSGIEPYLGNTEQMLSFVHVSDLAKIIIQAAGSAPVGHGYFVSDGNSYTIIHFNELIKKHLGRKTYKVIIPNSVIYPLAMTMEKFSAFFGKINSFNRERVKEFQAPNWACDSATLQEAMHYDFEHDLDSGIKETVKWYRKEGWLK